MYKASFHCALGPLPGHERGILVAVTLVRKGPDWLACATVPTRAGPLRFCARASEQTILALLRAGKARYGQKIAMVSKMLEAPPFVIRRVYKRGTGPTTQRASSGATWADHLVDGTSPYATEPVPWAGTASGAFFEDLWGGIKRVAKSKVLKKVLSTVKDVVTHPAFGAAVTLVPGVGTVVGPALMGVSLAVHGAEAAQKLLSRADKKDPKALAALAQVKAKAKAGDPKAVKALAILRQVHKAPKDLPDKPPPTLPSWIPNRELLLGPTPPGGVPKRKPAAPAPRPAPAEAYEAEPYEVPEDEGYEDDMYAGYRYVSGAIGHAGWVGAVAREQARAFAGATAAAMNPLVLMRVRQALERALVTSRTRLAMRARKKAA